MVSWCVSFSPHLILLYTAHLFRRAVSALIVGERFRVVSLKRQVLAGATAIPDPLFCGLFDRARWD
jgi:hypothetical protein